MPSMKRSRIASAVRSASARPPPSAGNGRRYSSGQSHRPAPGPAIWTCLRSAERIWPAAKASASVPLGQSDQFRIVARYSRRLVMIEKAAAGDDLEMGRIAHRPAQIGKPDAAKPLRADRPAGAWPAPPRSRPVKPPLRLFRRRIHQGVAARKMPERRPRRDAGAAGGLADADRVRPALADQLQRGVDQHPPEIAVVIGLWRGRRGRHGGAAWR